jgi:hypothetical protein
MKSSEKQDMTSILMSIISDHFIVFPLFMGDSIDHVASQSQTSPGSFAPTATSRMSDESETSSRSASPIFSANDLILSRPEPRQIRAYRRQIAFWQKSDQISTAS